MNVSRQQLERLRELVGEIAGCRTCAANPVRIVWGPPQPPKPCPECGELPEVIHWGHGG